MQTPPNSRNPDDTTTNRASIRAAWIRTVACTTGPDGYIGRKDANGRHYDSQGRYTGREDTSGRRYDNQGRYTGREDASGRRYDSQGRYRGRTSR